MRGSVVHGGRASWAGLLSWTWMRGPTAIALVLLVATPACSRTAMWLGEVAPPTEDAGSPRPVRCERELEVVLTPTSRAQLAVWVDGDPGFATLALTAATARHGIGNRPGALQMNSGYRWPLGRRENALPGWAGARLAAGEPPFRRVIFRSRPEGHASRAGSPPGGDTIDLYFCLPFFVEWTRRDALDAVTCASGDFHGDKGRYLDGADLAADYAEPEETGGAGAWRILGMDSAYPPRRDLAPSAEDHPDAARYAEDALRAMPELDAVTMATPAGGEPLSIVWPVPAAWPDHARITVSVEANTEGDYGDAHGPETFPTPTQPPTAWDFWAIQYGYPYRGQPSVIFDVPIEVPPTDRRVADRETRASVPARMGALDASLATAPVDRTIRDEPDTHPGSGADRLLRRDGARVRVTARQVRCRE